MVVHGFEKNVCCLPETEDSQTLCAGSMLNHNDNSENNVVECKTYWFHSPRDKERLQAIGVRVAILVSDGFAAATTHDRGTSRLLRRLVGQVGAEAEGLAVDSVAGACGGSVVDDNMGLATRRMVDVSHSGNVRPKPRTF